MASFTLIEPDAFNKVFGAVGRTQQVKKLDNEVYGQGDTIYTHVRRPVRGIQVKDDTYATLQVRDAQGIPLPLFDQAAVGDTGRGIRNSNFLVRSIREQRQEKQQVVLTFGTPYIFFFGEHPRSINVQGVLLNTEDFNWRAEWWENYDRYMRGTACTRAHTRVYLSWDDIVVEGYMTNSAASEDAEQPNFVQFQFEIFLTNHQNISNIGSAFLSYGEDFDLDPSKIKIPGTSDYASTTLPVRLANIQSAELAQGMGKNSLLESLRDGRLDDVANRILDLKGQTVDVMNIAGQFISGRTLRVPTNLGDLGSDLQVGLQTALASIPGAADTIMGKLGVQTVRSQNLKAATLASFSVALQERVSRTRPRVGLPLSANTDEFVSRSESSPTASHAVVETSQVTNPQNIGDKVTNFLKQIGVGVINQQTGISLDPTGDGVIANAKKSVFAIINTTSNSAKSAQTGLTLATTPIGSVL